MVQLTTALAAEMSFSSGGAENPDQAFFTSYMFRELRFCFDHGEVVAERTRFPLSKERGLPIRAREPTGRQVSEDREAGHRSALREEHVPCDKVIAGA